MFNRLLYFLGCVLLVLAVVDTCIVGLGVFMHFTASTSQLPPGAMVRRYDSVANTLASFLPWVFLLSLWALGVYLVRARRPLPPA